MSHHHVVLAGRLSIPLVVFLLGCAPLRTYGRSEQINAQCYAADELRRGEQPKSGAGTPVPVTPADSIARSNKPAAQIKCEGGLSR
jgi:hypothetical protein